MSRDGDLVEIVRNVRNGLADLKANVISRWGRIPHVSADPSSPPDGSLWVRSDDFGYRYRATGVTVTVPRGTIGVHTLTTTFNTAAVHTTLQDEGLTLTASEVAGRRWKFTIVGNFYVPGGANGFACALLRDGVSVRQWNIPTEALSTTVSHAFTLSHVETIAATHTGSVFKVQIAALGAATQVASFASVTQPRQLIIEDIGT